MAFSKLTRGQANRISLPFLSLALFVLAACTSSVRKGGDLVKPQSFKTADAWIRALNQHGVSCKADGAEPHPGPIRFRYVDLAICSLHSGEVLNVWIVKDAERTLKRYFMDRERPLFYLHLDNWVAVFPKSVPYKTVLRIRELFSAKITEGFFYEQ